MTRDAHGINRRTPLRVDASKVRAWQRRGAEKYAAKQRARRNAARLTTRIAKRPSPPTDWSSKVRQLALRRSGGACELCGDNPATHLHHRKRRRHGDHRIVNALHVCWICHDDVIHRNRGGIAYTNGWLVHSNDDPADVPVLIHDTAQLLTETGDYREAA